MTLHLLRDIPREIRDQIWEHTLRSAFGCVCLGVDFVPVDPRTYEVLTSEPVVRLKFLRTCSQVHLEARNILWRCNSLAFPQGQSVYSHSRLQDPRFCYAIESVNLGINLLDPGHEYGATARINGSLKIFGKWAREGNLRSLTLTVLLGEKHNRGIQGLNMLLAMRRFGSGSPDQAIRKAHHAYMARLEELEAAGSYLPVQLQRKIVLYTDLETLPGFRTKNHEPGWPQLVMRELHDKFGGEFWMDGRLYFKDYVELEPIFGIPPEEDKGDTD